MAEALVQDRLQPSLLDRLIDDAPQEKTEASDKHALTKQALRQAVLRDLVWLFNASGHVPKLDKKRFPHAVASVLNYGLEDMSGQYASTIDTYEMQEAIKLAVLRFEPRILEDTLEIEAVMEGSIMDAHNAMSLVVRGMLWAQPVPLEFLMKSRLDLEEGRVSTISS